MTMIGRKKLEEHYITIAEAKELLERSTPKVLPRTRRSRCSTRPGLALNMPSASQS